MAPLILSGTDIFQVSHCSDYSNHFFSAWNREPNSLSESASNAYFGNTWFLTFIDINETAIGNTAERLS